MGKVIINETTKKEILDMFPHLEEEEITSLFIIGNVVTPDNSVGDMYYTGNNNMFSYVPINRPLYTLILPNMVAKMFDVPSAIPLVPGADGSIYSILRSVSSAEMKSKG